MPNRETRKRNFTKKAEFDQILIQNNELISLNSQIICENANLKAVLDDKIFAEPHDDSPLFYKFLYAHTKAWSFRFKQGMKKTFYPSEFQKLYVCLSLSGGFWYHLFREFLGLDGITQIDPKFAEDLIKNKVSFHNFVKQNKHLIHKS